MKAIVWVLSIALLLLPSIGCRKDSAKNVSAEQKVQTSQEPSAQSTSEVTLVVEGMT